MFQTINLVVQLFMLFILGIAYYAFRSRRYLRHAKLMTFGWAVNIASFLLIMVPSLMMNAGTFLVPPIIFFDVMSIVHIPIGAAAMLLSTILVVRWAFNAGKVKGCMGKWPMRATMITWAASIVIGVSIYLTMPS
jgi:cbb3-type cytochrome oxidase subunit 3